MSIRDWFHRRVTGISAADATPKPVAPAEPIRAAIGPSPTARQSVEKVKSRREKKAVAESVPSDLGGVVVPRAVTTEPRRLVHDFIAANPGVNTRAIRSGVPLSHAAVDAILQDGETNGSLTVIVGPRNARCYSVGPPCPEVSSTVPVTDCAPSPNTPPVSDQLGLKRLLQPGLKATVPEPKTTVPDVIVPDRAQAVPAEVAALPIAPLLDDMRTDLPPRSPEEIAALLKVETPEQTQRRIDNDKQRVWSQRLGRGVNPQGAIVHDKPSGRTSWVKR